MKRIKEQIIQENTLEQKPTKTLFSQKTPQYQSVLAEADIKAWLLSL